VIDFFPDALESQPLPTDEFHVGDEAYRYPMLVKRYQSVLIDFVLWCSLMIVCMTVLGESEGKPSVMLSICLFFALVYEPLLTSYSATLGQYIIGIRVRSSRNPKKRINLLQAYIRIIVKFFLGWISFVTSTLIRSTGQFTISPDQVW
jgi:hypothetical protein